MTSRALTRDASELELLTGKKHVSFSEIKDWIECSYRHKLKHIDKLSEFDGSVYTAFGTAVHASCEEYIKTRVMKYELAIAEISREWDRLGFESKSLWIQKAVDVLQKVAGWLDNVFPGWEAIDAEELLYDPIPGSDHQNVSFKGYIDAIIKYKGKYILIDWKGQRLSDPVMTPNGWVKMGDLKIDQKITASDGSICKVTGIFPLGERDVYRVTMKDGSFVDCTDDHLWKVCNSQGNNKILDTKSLMKEKRYFFVPVISNPVQFEKEQNLDLDPYFLGVYLGDGHSCSKKSSVKITSEDIEIIENIKMCDIDIGYISKPKNRTNSYSIKGVVGKIRKLNLLDLKSYQKFIPEKYKFSSDNARLSMIQGLLDTDGWVQKGIPKYSTTSKLLAEDMRFLVESLGGICFTSTRGLRPGANHIEYIVTVKLPKGMKPFRLSRKLEKWNTNPKRKLVHKIYKIEKIGKDQMQCIKVDAKDSLYVTNNCILTHNTSGINGWSKQKKDEFKTQMQLVCYDLIWSQKHKVPNSQIECAFVLLNRDIANGAKNPIDLITLEIDDVKRKKSLKVINTMISSVKRGINFKAYKKLEYYNSPCKFCEFNGTEHCR